VGIEKIGAKTGPLLFAELREMLEKPEHNQDDYEVAYARLFEKGTPFYAIDITGINWTKIDTVADFEAANEMFGSPITTVSRGQQRVLDDASDDARNRN
ncbi:MAG: NDP-sugar pyrophosphorylase family protein, partial [Yoonia sp.]